jgi:hypothetical protein
VEVRTPHGKVRKLGELPAESEDEDGHPLSAGRPRATVLKVESGVKQGRSVVVSHYMLRGVAYYVLRPADRPRPTVYDEEPLPRYLFLGASVVTLATLLILWWQMPDLLSRAAWVLRAFNRSRRLHAIGTHHLPADGPAVLVTNCRDEAACRDVVAATERAVRFVHTKLTDDALAAELRHVGRGAVLALSADAGELLPVLQTRLPATYLPVYHGPALAADGAPIPGGPLRVAFGPPLPAVAAPDTVAVAILRAGSMPEEEAE